MTLPTTPLPTRQLRIEFLFAAVPVADSPTSDCCTADVQAGCCEPEDKAACCGGEGGVARESCGCHAPR